MRCVRSLSRHTRLVVVARRDHPFRKFHSIRTGNFLFSLCLFSLFHWILPSSLFPFDEFSRSREMCVSAQRAHLSAWSRSLCESNVINLISYYWHTRAWLGFLSQTNKKHTATEGETKRQSIIKFTHGHSPSSLSFVLVTLHIVIIVDERMARASHLNEDADQGRAARRIGNLNSTSDSARFDSNWL